MSKNVDLLKGLFGDQVTELTEEHTKEISTKLDKLVETRVESKVKFQTEVIEAETKEKYDSLLEEATQKFETGVKTIEEETTKLAKTYKEKLEVQVKEMSTKLTEAKEKELSTFKEEIVEKLDKYLALELGKKIPETYVESVAQVSVLQPIVEGFKKTFEDNFVKLDSENLGLIRDAKEEIVSVREDHAKIVNENMTLNSELKSLKRSLKISEVCEGLTDTQSERAVKLLESYDTEELEERYESIKDLIIEGFEVPVKEEEVDEIGDASKAEADGVQKVEEEEESETEESTEEVTEEEETEEGKEDSEKLEEQRLIEGYAEAYRKQAGLLNG
jgi:regulator of replication initiation timing